MVKDSCMRASRIVSEWNLKISAFVYAVADHGLVEDAPCWYSSSSLPPSAGTAVSFPA